MSAMIATMRICNSEYPCDDLTAPLSSLDPSAEFFIFIRFFWSLSLVNSLYSSSLSFCASVNFLYSWSYWSHKSPPLVMFSLALGAAAVLSIPTTLVYILDLYASVLLLLKITLQCFCLRVRLGAPIMLVRHWMIFIFEVRPLPLAVYIIPYLALKYLSTMHLLIHSIYY